MPALQRKRAHPSPSPQPTADDGVIVIHSQTPPTPVSPYKQSQATYNHHHYYDPGLNSAGVGSGGGLGGMGYYEVPQQQYPQHPQQLVGANGVTMYGNGNGPLLSPYAAVPNGYRATEYSVAPSAKRRKKIHPESFSVAQYATQPVAPHSYQPELPTSAEPLPPCDDKEGHYIVVPHEYLTERYKIVKLLGQGTFGKVVEAVDLSTGTRVAIKIIRAVQKYRDASRTEIKVLDTLKRHDPENKKRCIHLIRVFDHRNHICMVFELLAQSVFDFLKENAFAPFPPWHIRSFGSQILEAVAFLHDLRLIHTDLKPENLMLEDNTAQNFQLRRNSKVRKELNSSNIRLIDFGSAIFETDYHSSVVSTRHYRAPEIILGLGWSFPCDLWSVGCILVEFYTGDALFQTHDNLEHLALMEAVLGKIPEKMIRASIKSGQQFFRMNKVDFPNTKTKAASKKFVRQTKALRDLIKPNDEFSNAFYDLLTRLLAYDPRERITAREALHHRFFSLPYDVVAAAHIGPANSRRK
ncbi:dual specificity protein kinase kns1 [Borealophlyctis nickersoniae]|nr:dual specificity protein kinase kns1 [Borealophlyctis nickersoniae]